MEHRVRLIGPPGTITELVASVLGFGGFAVELGAAGPAGEAEAGIVVLVCPGPAEWSTAAGFSGGMLLVTERHFDDAEVVEAVLAGADAVVHPDASPAELLAAADAVRRGSTMLSPAQARLLAGSARAAVARAPRTSPSLSLREQAILESAERGESVKQTARALGITPKTVENLQTRLFRKLGARNRAHAVFLAHRCGLLPQPALLAS